MTDAMIVDGVRTPVARAHRGSLVDVDAFALAEVVTRAILERTGVPVEEVDDIVLAESLQGGGVIARHTAVELAMAHVPASP